MKTTLNIRTFVTLFLGVLFSMSLAAQTVIPDSLSLFTDITAYSLNYDDTHHQDGVGVTEGTGGWAVEFIKANDWIEFQILTDVAGQYVLTAPISSSRTTSNVNVSVYPVDGEFVMNGTTLYTYNGQWQRPEEYLFPFTVEAGVVYNLRVSFVGHGCNFFNEGLAIKALEGSPDATLSDIQVDGVTVANFDPETESYSLAVQPDEWIGAITATANDPLSTVTITDDFSAPEAGTYSTDYDITVQSEAGITKVYTVKVCTPIEIMDALDMDLAVLSANPYYNNGVGVGTTKVNSFANGDYVDFYVFSAWDANYNLHINFSNGYLTGQSYLNFSTLEVGDTTWTPNDIYTKPVSGTYLLEDPTTGSWSTDAAQDQNYVISLKEYEPVLLRIYSKTSNSNACDIFAMDFTEIKGSIDATLSDLTVDGTSVIDFDPMTTSYSVALPAGATTATVSTTATDANSTITGAGVIDLVGNVTADTLVVTSESGFDISYIVNFYTPIAIDFMLADTFSLAMYSDMFYNGGANVADTKINKSYDSTYVEYYVYSETDKDVHLIANMSNGNPDTISCEMNVSTYTLDTEWMLDDASTRTVPYSDSMMWSLDKAEELEFNLSLKANEAVILRLFFITDGTLGSGDIYSLYILDGVSSSSPYVAEASDVNIYGGTSNLTVDFGSNAGSTVKVFNIAGRLVVNETTDSSKQVYSVNEAGIYIVQVVDANNNMKTVKCLVR